MGQSWPEGRFCSNLLSGCVNTALAQIMAYFEHPIQMNVTYDNAEISVLNLDWSEIKKYVGSSYSNTANSTTLENIGHLCRQLGQLTNTKYEAGGSYARSDSALIIMSDLGYTVSPNLI